jgi:serine/threonine protein kinase
LGRTACHAKKVKTDDNIVKVSGRAVDDHSYIYEHLPNSPLVIPPLQNADCAELMMNQSKGMQLMICIITKKGYCILMREERGEGGREEIQLSSKQRMMYALDMARGLRDLHNIDGDGVVSATHGDLKEHQYLLKKDGRLVLGDFNKGGIH